MIGESIRLTSGWADVGSHAALSLQSLPASSNTHTSTGFTNWKLAPMVKPIFRLENHKVIFLVVAGCVADVQSYTWKYCTTYKRVLRASRITFFH